MKTPTLNELWRRYLMDVVPADAPEPQIHQARESFYLGALSLLVQLDKLGREGRASGDPQPLLNALQDWSREGKQYAEAVKKMPDGNEPPHQQGDHHGRD